MKTAVSIPDSVFERVDRLARRTKRSRSRIVSDALDEYVARHATDEVTAALNATIEAAGESDTGFVSNAARRTLERSDW